MVSEQEPKGKQSWGEIIQFLDGLCFGKAPDGRTVCLGKEADVKEMLDKAKRSINPQVNDIIDLERELLKQKEQENGEPTITTKHTTRKPIIGNNKRIRPSRVTGHKQPNIKRPKKK